MKKKTAKMTFKEFFDSAKDEETKQFVVAFLKSEGFTEKQVNEMKMEKVWKLLRLSGSDHVFRCIDLVSIALEKDPKLAPLISPYLKRAIEQLEEIERELKEELEKREKHKRKE